MGAALVAGLLDAGLDAESLAVAEADAARRHELEALLPGVRTAPSAPWVVGDADVVVVAVKPGRRRRRARGRVERARRRTRSCSRSRPGSRSRALEAAAPGPAGRAGDAQHPGARARGRRRDRRRHPRDRRARRDRAPAARRGRARSSSCPRPRSTRSPASRAPGPAYVFLLAEAMIEAGVLNGLPRDVATDAGPRHDPRRRRDAHRLRRHRRAAAGRGHLAGWHDRGGPARARGRARCAPRCSRP